MSGRGRILGRLTKLLALARSPNSNEAETAGRLAEQLMKEHGLTKADVEGYQPEGPYEKPIGSKGFEAVWKFSLVTATARFYGCEAISLQVGTRRKIRLVGDRADVEKASELFESLLLTLKQLEKIEAQRLSRFDEVEYETSPQQYVDSFRRGVTVSVIEAMQKIRPSRFGIRKPAPYEPPSSDSPPPTSPVSPEVSSPPTTTGEASPDGKARWFDKFWPWKKRERVAVLPVAGDSSTGSSKGLVVVSKPSKDKDEGGYREKVKTKYSPRKVKLRLEDADDDGAYWRGYELARQLVVLPAGDSTDDDDWNVKSSS